MKRLRTDERPYAVLDVETDGLRGPLTWWTVACEHGRRAEGASVDELWRLVLSGNVGRVASCSWRDHLWWAHNGGSYDYLYLLGPARRDVFEHGAIVRPISRADAVIGWRVSRSRHRTDLRDSYALLPAKLGDLAAAFAPELPKLAAPFDPITGRGFDPADPAHRAYATRDTDSLLASIVRYRDLVRDQWGVLPSWSAASTALRAWRSTLPLPLGIMFDRPPRAAAAFARDAYYGGMVRVASVAVHADAVTIDVNGMYPAVMREAGVPDGPVVRVNRYIPGRPGFYRIVATVPDDAPWTILPHRDEQGTLAWPTGTFTTTVSALELEWARSHGMTVDVLDGWAWSRIVRPFEAYLDACAAMRRRGGAFDLTGKLAANSLYGKFGSRPEHDDWAIAAERPGPEWYPPPHDPTDPAEVERYRGLWVHPDQPVRGDYLLPHWAAWITAAARLRLTALAEAVGFEAVIYTDTDSLTIPADRLDRLPPGTIGSGPGQAKIERRWALYRVHAPKVYEGVIASGEDAGKRIRKAKGIPRRLVDQAFEEGSIAWASPNGSLAVLAGAPMLTSRTRSLSSIEGSAAWRLGSDGLVRPVHLDTPREY